VEIGEASHGVEPEAAGGRASAREVGMALALRGRTRGAVVRMGRDQVVGHRDIVPLLTRPHRNMAKPSTRIVAT